MSHNHFENNSTSSSKYLQYLPGSWASFFTFLEGLQEYTSRLSLALCALLDDKILFYDAHRCLCNTIPFVGALVKSENHMGMIVI